jgi:hypothetical protein
MANTLRVKQQPRRRKMGSLLSGVLVLCSTLVTTAQPAFASSTLQRYVPEAMPVGFTVDRSQSLDDVQQSYPYTMYFSSTTGWFTGTADFNAPRTLVQMYRQNNSDDEQMKRGFAEGRLPIKINGSTASTLVFRSFGSLWWKTPTAFIEIYASSPKMSQAYLLKLAKGIRSNNRADEPLFKMPSPAGTRTKFAGRLNRARKSWSYTLKSATQEITVGSEAVSAIELEAEAITSSPIGQTTVRGKPALKVESQVLWMETPDQLVWVGSKSPADSAVATLAESLKPTDEQGWQTFQQGAPSVSSAPAPYPYTTLPEPSAPIASGEFGTKLWSIARLQLEGKPCYLITIGLNQIPICPSPTGLVWNVYPTSSTDKTIATFGIATENATEVVFKDPQSANELGRGNTIAIAGEGFKFFFIQTKMAIKPESELAFSYDSSGNQVSGPAGYSARIGLLGG